MRKLIFITLLIVLFTIPAFAKELIISEGFRKNSWSHSSTIKGISLRSDGPIIMIKLWGEKKYKGKKKVTLNPKTWKNINEIENVPVPDWNYAYIMFRSDQGQEAIMLYRAISSKDTEHVRITTNDLYFKHRETRNGFDAIVQWGKKGSVRLY